MDCWCIRYRPPQKREVSDCGITNQGDGILKFMVANPSNSVIIHPSIQESDKCSKSL
jgi:hypothetical protein